MLQCRFQKIVTVLIVFIVATSSIRVQAKQNEEVKIEVCFVLDTTGSMGNLIRGAKQKIWSIANHIVVSTKAGLDPEAAVDVQFSLVGYRDRGDQYITRLTDLNPDIDVIYNELQSYQAQGGGDGPESVNQALYDAVHRITWSSGEAELDPTVKVLFLVGDYPPHMDYEEQQYPETVRQAVDKGIVVNAIQAGNHGPTLPIWKEIATLGGGLYSQIGQSGDMQTIATHYDQDLVALNSKLGQTFLPYGSREQQEASRRKRVESEMMSEHQIADRTSFYARQNRLLAAGDLIDDLDAGLIELSSLNDDTLPIKMRSMTAQERLKFIDSQRQRRTAYQRVILDLAEARESEITKKRSRSSLDNKVIEQINSLLLKQ